VQLVMRNNVKDDRISEFVDWVKANRAAMEEHAPEGWSYAGTFVTVYGMGTHEVEIRWELDDYAAMSPGGQSEEWDQLVKESAEFFVGGVGQNSLMKSVDDVVIIA
jgi:hypothetical protein